MFKNALGWRDAIERRWRGNAAGVPLDCGMKRSCVTVSCSVVRLVEQNCNNDAPDLRSPPALLFKNSDSAVRKLGSSRRDGGMIRVHGSRPGKTEARLRRFQNATRSAKASPTTSVSVLS
jgi:hypothetical protein